MEERKTVGVGGSGEQTSEVTRKKDVQMPWEFRITRFKDVRIHTTTGVEQYNYWEVNKNGELEVGYHGAKETGGARVLGELVDLGNGKYSLLLGNELKPEVADRVLSAVRDSAKTKGIDIVSIAPSTQKSDKKAGGKANIWN